MYFLTAVKDVMCLRATDMGGLEEAVGEGKYAGGSTHYVNSMASIFLSVIDGMDVSVQFVVSSCLFRCPWRWQPVIHIDVSSL